MSLDSLRSKLTDEEAVDTLEQLAGYRTHEGSISDGPLIPLLRSLSDGWELMEISVGHEVYEQLEQELAPHVRYGTASPSTPSFPSFRGCEVVLDSNLSAVQWRVKVKYG